MKLTVGSHKSAKMGAEVSRRAPANVLVCEASGKKVKFADLDDTAILSGDERVFSSKEIAVAHMKGEKRGFLLVHRNAIYADPKKNVRRFSTRAAEFLDLMESIKEEGILQPLMVHRSLDHKPAMYELRAGFRRFEATKRLDIDLLPITVIDDSVSPKVAGILENLREDMKPLELATAIKSIMSEPAEITDKKTGKKTMKKPSQRKVAAMLGIAQSRVSDLIGMVSDLHPKVIKAVANGDVPVSKGSLLKQLPPKSQVKALKMAQDLDIKDLRKLVQDEREKLGVDPPRHGSDQKSRKKKVKNRQFKMRNVGELVTACMKAETVYFDKKRTKANRAAVSALQFCLGILGSPTDKPIDPVEIERKMATQAEDLQKQRLANLKRGREARAAKNAEKSKVTPAKKRLPKPKPKIKSK